MPRKQKVVVGTKKQQKIVKKDKGATQTVIVNVSKGGGGKKRQPKMQSAVNPVNYVVSHQPQQNFSNISELIKLIRSDSIQPKSIETLESDKYKYVEPLKSSGGGYRLNQPIQHSFGMQTEPEYKPEMFSFGVQTDAPFSHSFGIQTEPEYKPEIMSSGTQTAESARHHFGIQTEPVEITPFSNNFNDQSFLNRSFFDYEPVEIPERKMFSQETDITELDRFHPVAGENFSYEQFPNYYHSEEITNPLLSPEYQEKASERKERFHMSEQDERAQQRLNEEWLEFVRQQEMPQLESEEKKEEYEKEKIMPEERRGRGGYREGSGRPERRVGLLDEFDGVTLSEILAGHYGFTKSHHLRSQPTKKQIDAQERYMKQKSEI